MPVTNDPGNGERNALPGALDPGMAKRMMDSFFLRMAKANDAPQFPEAVVYSIANLRLFLDAAERTISPDEENPVPLEQRGIALVPGYISGNVTYMLVATRFTADESIHKITTINNPVTGIHVNPPYSNPGIPGGGDDPLEPPVGDESMDTGNAFP